jgi:EAL domain-containing protein (putative c-di-GMP-specific phosphodiesterase class I)
MHHERSGLIVPLGRLVLESACRQLKTWQDKLGATFPISANVSREQLRTGNFVDTVRDVLARTELDPAALILELTESTILQSPDEVRQFMEQLTAIGVRFAIDDFGVEHSALSHLAHLPLDAIKIDRAFVSRMTADPRFASIVQAIVSIAKIMDKRTVAEGIETPEQRIFLRAYGCDAVQGYLFSKALLASDFEKYLAQV